MAAFEARAAGLPVLGYSNTGLVDFIVDGYDGLLVSSKEEMTQALVNLIQDPARLRGLLRTTRSVPPAITADDAMSAISALYERARRSTVQPEQQRHVPIWTVAANVAVAWLRHTHPVEARRDQRKRTKLEQAENPEPRRNELLRGRPSLVTRPTRRPCPNPHHQAPPGGTAGVTAILASPTAESARSVAQRDCRSADPERGLRRSG
jgi:hypothetical protein